MLTHPEELRDRVEDVLAEVSGLSTVAAIGFREARADVIEKSLGAIAQESRWKLVDVQQDGAALRAAATAPVLVIATGTEVPSALALLIRAAVDKQSEVDFGDGTMVRRPDHQQIVILCRGYSQFGEVRGPLRQIPYWDFVPGGDA